MTDHLSAHATAFDRLFEGLEEAQRRTAEAQTDAAYDALLVQQPGIGWADAEDAAWRAAHLIERRGRERDDCCDACAGIVARDDAGRGGEDRARRARKER